MKSYKLAIFMFLFSSVGLLATESEVISSAIQSCQTARNMCLSGRMLVGKYCPQCQKANSNLYELKQCNGSTGFCWCVNPVTGQENSPRVRGPLKCPRYR